MADIARVEMSSHLFPEVSAHLLAVTPTAHWIEYVDWALPVLQEPLKVVDGYVTPPVCAAPDSCGTRTPWRVFGEGERIPRPPPRLPR